MNIVGMPEIVMIAIILALLLIPAALVIGLVIYFVKRGKKASVPPSLPTVSRPQE